MVLIIIKIFLVGGRAAGMGGAYIAISDDAAGVYYNPAGIAFSPSNSLSGSAKVFGQNTETYEKVISDKNYNGKSNNFLPSYFGFLQKRGKSTHALTYILQSADIEHQDQVFENVGTANIFLINNHLDDQIHLFGYSYARKFSKRFSLGLSLHLHYRDFKSYINQSIEGGAANDTAIFSNTSLTETGLRPKLGLLYQFDNGLAIGATVAQTILLESEAKNQLQSKTAASSDLTITTSTSKEKRETPQELGFGMAYFVSKSLLFAFDIDFYLAGSEDDEDVLNWALGSEYYLSRKWAIRGGIYTNNTNNPIVSSETAYPNDFVNMLGITFGASYYRNKNSIHFGLSQSTGTGKAQISIDTNESVNLTKSATSFIVSAGYGF